MTRTPEGSEDRRHRSRARAWILQVLYRWEAKGTEGSLLDALNETQSSRRISPVRLPYVRRVVHVLAEHLDEVDRAVQASLDNWDLNRLSRIDRGVLRLAATEILYLEDIPPVVSIQEGILLAERYGGDDSARFVNGVLDALYRSEVQD